MKCILILLLHLNVAPVFAQNVANNIVRVLLTEESKKIELQSPGPVEISSGSQVLQLNHSHTKITLSYQAPQWNIDVSGSHQEHRVLKGPSLKIQSDKLYWNVHVLNFPVSLHFKNKRHQMVGHMDVEEYLKGVLPHEMPSSWPQEALKAQAVASRSYALWKAQHQESSTYDLRTSILDQMFRLNQKNESTSVPPKVSAALKSTRGVSLIDNKQKVVKTYFHSDCGGATDGAKNVWGTDQPQASIRDIACAKRSSGWTSVWPADRLQKKLSTELFLPPTAELQNIFVRTQLKSERVAWVDLSFSQGILKRVRGEDMRRMLGYDKIKSTLFAVEKKSDGFSFQGRGFGHGVGLCQYGARAMAQAGQDYKSILKHYYPSSTLRSPLEPLPAKETGRTVSAL